MKRLGPINWGDPVVREHPLNQGRVAWWLAAPSFYGMTWRDLMGSNTGTLTNMVQGATSGFNATTRPGGFGEVRFDGTNDYVPVSDALFPTSGAKTISVWFLITAGQTLTSGQYRCLFDYGTKSLQQNVWFVWENSSDGANVIAATPYGTGVTTSHPAPNDGLWHHAALTITSVVSTFATWTIYFDGLAAGSASLVTSTTLSGTAKIGGTTVITPGYWHGALDDVSVFNRALSASEIQSIYNESRRGYPNTLRRMAPAYARLSTVIRRLLYRDASRSI